MLMGRGDTVGAENAYEKSLEVYQQWKDEDRISDVEKDLVSLKKDEVDWLMKQDFP
jgi:hypothetical protein